MKNFISNIYSIIVVPIFITLIFYILTQKFPKYTPPDWVVYNLISFCFLIILTWYSLVIYFENKYLKNKNIWLEKTEKKSLEQVNEQLKKELNEEKQRNFKPNHIHKRFEEIIKKELKYIAIDYKPFFWMEDDAIKETPKGIGYELMSKIFEPFNVKLTNETPANGYSWKSIFEDFSHRKMEIDFIMTPMYETRSRLYEYDVIYSIPLFYSDIGIYVKRNRETHSLKLSFDDAIKYLKSKRDISEHWKVEYLDGEISEIVGKKLIYEYEDKRRQLSKDDSRRYGYKDFSKKLHSVASEDKSSGDVIFMEKFKAESIINEGGLNVINILKDNQLVYPVSFVLHKEETVLRNFINLRITELRLNGELQKVIKNNALQIEIKDETVIDKVFLQKYDFSLIDKSIVENRSRFSDRMRDEFDLLDKFYGNYISFQKNINDIVKNFRKDENLNILEIGFGSGITTEIILEARKECEDNIVVVDNDDFMKKQIENNKNVNPKKITIEINNVIKYLEEYDNNPFDIVVSGYTIHNFTKQQRERLYELLYQKMSNNSIFINADKIAPDDDAERIESLKYRVDKYIDYLKTHSDKYLLIEEWVSHYIKDQSDNIVMKKTDTINTLIKKGFSENNIKIKVPEGIDNKEMMAILTAYKKNQ